MLEAKALPARRGRVGPGASTGGGGRRKILNVEWLLMMTRPFAASAGLAGEHLPHG
jgi:hypothetical protein